MKTKTEFWQKIWTKWSKKKPPESDELILLWNPLWKKPIIMEASLARYAAIAMQEERYVSPDRVYQKWCFITPPKKS